MTDSLRRLPRFQEGQVFKGHAFGESITVMLDYPEWVEIDGGFWRWEIKTDRGGGGSLAEDVIASEFELVE